MKYAQLIAAEYDLYDRKYALVRSADIEMPGNLMIDGDSRTYPSGKKYEGGFFVFLDRDFPGTSGEWDSWASITGGEYDNKGKQYALSLDMSSYGYYGVRISGEYGDTTYFNFKLDYNDNDICKLFDHNGWPTLWYNTLGPKVIYSSLKQLGTLYSLDVSGSSTLNSVACTQVNCSGNVFGQDLVGTNVWADYVESSGYVVANTIEATNWIGLPSTPVNPTDLLPLTLDKTQNFVGINKVDPAYDLDVYGDAHVSGFSTLNGVMATNLLVSGNITGDTIDANTSLNTQEINCLGTVYCDTINAQHYVNLPVSDITPITLDKVNTRVGINKTNPSFTLDVGGDTHVSGKMYLSGDTTCIGSVTANTISAQTYLNLPPVDIKPIYLDTINNYVGINTNSPTNTLDVQGTSVFRGTMSQLSGTCTLQSTTVNNGLFLKPDAGSDANNLFYLSPTNNFFCVDAKSQTGSTAGTNISFRTSGAGSNSVTEGMRIDSAQKAWFYGDIIQTSTKQSTLGYVKCGTIQHTPTSSDALNLFQTFAVSNSLQIQGRSQVGATNGTSIQLRTSAAGSNVASLAVDIKPNLAVDFYGDITQTNNNTASLGALIVPSISCSGNVSGTLTTASQPNITSVGTLSTLNVTGDVAIDSNTIKVDSTNNRVGICTTNPAYNLEVTGTCNITGNLTVGGTIVNAGLGTTTITKNSSVAYSPAVVSSAVFQSVATITIPANSVCLVDCIVTITKNSSSTTGAAANFRLQSGTTPNTLSNKQNGYLFSTGTGVTITIINSGAALNDSGSGHLIASEVQYNTTSSDVTLYLGWYFVATATAANFYRIDANDLVATVTKVGTI